MIKQLILLLAILLVTILAIGCEKETTTTSSEYREIIGQNSVDTVFQTDTVIVNQGGATIYDTTFIVDTIIQNTSTVDTVIQYITQVDTVYQGTSSASVHTAFTAMQAYTDQVVIDDITATVGYTDGWVFYLSAYQSYIDNPATNVWDLGGYIDYWAPDFSDFYAYEYGWRMTYVSGDPNDPNNWDISEIPSAVSNGASGIKKVDKTEVRPSLK